MCVCVCVFRVSTWDCLWLSVSSGFFLIDHYWVLWRWKGFWELISCYESWVSSVWCEYILITQWKKAFIPYPFPLSISPLSVSSPHPRPHFFLLSLVFSFFLFLLLYFFLVFSFPYSFLLLLIFIPISSSPFYSVPPSSPSLCSFHSTLLNSSPFLYSFPFLSFLCCCLLTVFSFLPLNYIFLPTSFLFLPLLFPIPISFPFIFYSILSFISPFFPFLSFPIFSFPSSYFPFFPFLFLFFLSLLSFLLIYFTN